MKNLTLKAVLLLSVSAFLFFGCGNSEKADSEEEKTDSTSTDKESVVIKSKVRTDAYASFRLTTDLRSISPKQKQMIPLLIKAAKIMDELFWRQSYGKKEELLSKIEDESAKRFAEINYGPWDRLNGNEPFIENAGPKPKGANFYPADMTKEEFEKADLADKDSQYTLLVRNDEGKLMTLPYSEAYKKELQQASEYLRQASRLAENKSLQKYLELRAEALMTDKFDESDIAWLDMQDNTLDIIIGPIENYEDKLFGKKTAYEAYVLVKDKEWSDRLSRYSKLLPGLQKGLPVPDKYKKEEPGRNAQLNAYDIIYYAGDCNAGSKTIAVNLPNSEEIQLNKGTRRSQLKNAMRAKYDKILVPISEVLIDAEQRKHITFNAFFGNTMFHEVAHGLGIKTTINGKGKVKDALGELHSPIEEGKADILGLYMVSELRKDGELTEGELMDNYVTFLAGIFRSVRFGAASAHGKANMMRFNYFNQMGAFTRQEDGTYRVNPDQMAAAVRSLSEKILTVQGDGDYKEAKRLLDEVGVVGQELESDLSRLESAGIKVDIVFNQGIETLGL